MRTSLNYKGNLRNRGKLQFIDKIIMTLLLFYVLIQFHSHILTSEMKYILSGLILLRLLHRLICGYKYLKKSHHEAFMLIVVISVLMISINILLSPKTYIVTNIMQLLVPMLTIFYTESVVDDIKGIDDYFKNIITILNFYFLANSILIYLQISGVDLLVDRTFYSELSFDYYSGMFGGNDGTHRVTVFTSLLTILNLFYYKTLPRKKRLLICGFFGIGLFITCYTSTQNDNVSFFVFLPLTVICYFAIKSQKLVVIIKKIYKPLLIAIFIIIIVSIALSNNISLFGRIIKRINNTVLTYGIGTGGVLKSKDERAILFIYAISHGGIFGKGIGSIRLLADPSIITSYGRHFGMSSIQSIIYVCGGLIYLLYLILITMYCTRNGKQKSIPFLVIFCFILFSSYYSQVLTVFNSSILFSFTLALFCRINTDKTNSSEVKNENSSYMRRYRNKQSKRCS